MASKYSVVQYVPNPNSGERINIGVLVWDDKGVLCHFSDNWSRVRTFGGESVDYLRNFAHDISHFTAAQGNLLEERITSDTLQKWAGSWKHSIQFTEPAGSLDPAAEVLDSMVKIFLRPTVHRRRSQTRKMVAARAYAKIFDAVKARVKEQDRAEHLVRQREVLAGRVEPHTFDVVL